MDMATSAEPCYDAVGEDDFLSALEEDPPAEYQGQAGVHQPLHKPVGFQVPWKKLALVTIAMLLIYWFLF